MSAAFPRGSKLLIATHNKGKLAEFADLLAPFGVEPISAGSLGLAEPVETGTTFEENAALKAVTAAKAAGMPALSDDSGVCVVAIGNRPGVYSADWAGPGKDFAQAMRNVQEELTATGGADKRAFFVAVLCLAQPDGSTRFFRGEIHGEVVWPPRGSAGFGYDPMFLPEGHSRTFGEMAAEEKHGWRPGGHALSHRARAFAAFAAAMLDSPEAGA
jgi:XTP/dITP diphosphohydrolase